MAYNGTAGSTQAEMAKVLGVQQLSRDAVNAGQAALIDHTSQTSPKITVSIANALWTKQDLPFLTDFLQRMQKTFHAQLSNVDFMSPATAPLINTWASEHTNGLIKEVVSPSDFNQYTRLVLTNAVYYKGVWHTEFDPRLTETMDFTRIDQTTVKVPMMSQTDSYLYFSSDNFQSISLPYGEDKRFCLLLFLPRKDMAFANFVKTLTVEHWKQWLPKYRYEECDLLLPRFTTNYAIDLLPPLKQLGMPSLFDEKHADLSGITRAEGLYVNEVFQKTRFEVNEEGTRASAVTAINESTNSYHP